MRQLVTTTAETQTGGAEEFERKLVALELERDALIQIYSVQHWQVQNVDQQIRLAEKR